MLLLIAIFFSGDVIFANKYASLSNITLLNLLGFTRHYIDFRFCNSVIFTLLGCFKSKQSRYINIPILIKHKRQLTTQIDLKKNPKH